MRILLFLLFPIFLQAQIQRAYGVIEIGSFPTSSATGPKFAYRPADSSFYRWVSGSTWTKIIPDEPDTLYLKQLSGTTALVDGDTIDISTYLLKADTASMLAAYVKLVGYGLIKTGQTIRVDTTAPDGLATRKYALTLPTILTANYAAISNGTNLITRNLFDNNVYAGVIAKPWKFGEWTTAGRPTGTFGYTGFNITLGHQEFYDGSQWLPTAFWSKSGNNISYSLGAVSVGNTAIGSQGVEITTTGSTAVGGGTPFLSAYNSGSTIAFGTEYNAAIATNRLSVKLTPNAAVSSTPAYLSFGYRFGLANLSLSGVGLDFQDINMPISQAAGYLQFRPTASGIKWEHASGNQTSVRWRYDLGFSLFSQYGAVEFFQGKQSVGTTIRPPTTALKGLIVNGLSGQVGNLQEWQSNGSIINVVTPDGKIGLGTTNPLRAVHTTGDIIVGDSALITTTPVHTAITGLLTRAANGWIGRARLGTDFTYSGDSIKLASSPTWLKPQLESVGNVKITSTNSLTLKQGTTRWTSSSDQLGTRINSGGLSLYKTSTGNFGGSMSFRDTINRQNTFQFLQDDRSSIQAGGTGRQLTLFADNTSLPGQYRWIFGARVDTSTTIPTFRAMLGDRYASAAAPVSINLVSGVANYESIATPGIQLQVSGANGKKAFSLNADIIAARVGGKVYFASDSTFSFDPATDVLQLSQYGTGTKEAADLSKTQSAYIAGFATDGTLLDYPILSLPNGIYTGSGTLVSSTTRALISPDNKLLFSQLYNSNADSAFVQFYNIDPITGNRSVVLGLTDTVHTGGIAYIRAEKDEANDKMNIELKTVDQDGISTLNLGGNSIAVTATDFIEHRAAEVRLNDGEVLMNLYGQGNMKSTDLSLTDSKFVAKFATNGKITDYYLARDTFIEDVTLFSVGTMMYDCQELTIVSSMTSTAPTHMEIRFPDAADYLRGKKIIVTSIRKDAGIYVPQIKVVGGVSRLYFTTTPGIGGADPSDQSVLSLDDSTWPEIGTYEFTCLKINNTPAYRWVLKQR